MLNLRRMILFLVALLCLATAAMAQEATIVGSVTDPAGAVVPGATISLTNTETGQVTNTVTNEAGQFVQGSLRIGTYSVKAEAKGFKLWTTSGLQLQVGDRARVDVKLEVGATSETVTVESEPIRVQADSAEISEMVTGTQVTNQLSNGRHFALLAALIPGASSNMASGLQFPAAGLNMDISFNGNNSAHNVWLVDGAENYDRGGWGVNFVPSMDAVAEFRTMTSNYGAEYGLASGATLSMAFKSGTRDLHGAGWEFLRNDALDANDFFRNKAGGAVAKGPAPLRYNVFGFNVGGPVTIGKLNKNRDKTFFFYNMEWRKIRTLGATTTRNVPLQSWYTGDMSSLPATIRVPSATVLSQSLINKFAAVGLNPGDPFPNNRIPSSLIDPNATAFLGTGALPTAAYTENGVGKWTGSAAAPQNVREEVVRIDHRFTDKFSVFGHFVADSFSKVDTPVIWSGGSYPTIGDTFNNPSWNYVIRSAYTISPTVLNETNFNMGGNKIDIMPLGIYKKPSGWNVPEMFADNASGKLPRIGWAKELGTNFNTWNYPWHNNSRLWQIRDDLSVVRGRHELKMGGSLETYTKYQMIGVNTAGNFNFDGNYTGSSFADFLLGLAANYNEAQVQDGGNWTNRSFAFFFQDNWRVNNRLTLNLGLRWEGMPAVTENINRMSDFYPNLYDPAQAPRWMQPGNRNSNLLDTTGPGFKTVAGVPLANQAFYLNGMGIAGAGVPVGLVKNTWNNWAPRIGFAYDLDGRGKTVIRAGFGRMYERVQGNDVYNTGPNPPFSYSPTVYNVLLSNPNTLVSTGVTPDRPNTPAGITGKMADGYKAPNSNQWSFSIQRELFPRAVIQAAYVGNNQFHQSITRDINSPLVSNLTDRLGVVGKTVNLDRARPYPGLGAIVLAENTGTGNYHGFQTNLRVNAAKGLDLQIAYTYSRAINDVSLQNQGSGGDLGATDNPYDRSYSRGLSPWDRPHIVSVNYTYMLPFFKNGKGAAKTLLGGWQLNGIASFNSGGPIAIIADNSRLGMSGAVQHPNFTGTVQYTDQVMPDGSIQWFSPTGFSIPADGTFGNAPKDIVRGPGQNNWNLSLTKNFAGIPFINKEGANLQMRFETFNTFNHTQWAGVNNNLSNAGFGNVNGNRAPRQMQLGMRFLF